ncbi:hypothetical protein PVL30_002464 [Lodderomyces elongisporus]|uniref:uncharacterized protein n=1 Tax=Lodderomyces elongisporus TaxID=36914 RepID=UPI00291C8934|nr:uncharacterized protein PVL30_002464 [Lodderomyces elongisporus]WLF78722.1 hypothetical protein PVL30_002464 [Lodderomyces elongisporus]
MPPRTSQSANAETHWKNISSGNGAYDNHESPQYTLPGVINYLTSEFTNLERFKIMTNLEKSEMKYKIVHLQGEIKSLKFINEKQKTRIESLEMENQLLRARINGEVTKSAKVTGSTIDTHLDTEFDGLSEVDIQQIKESKQRLKDSTREIISLLKTPTSNLELLNLPKDDRNDFDVLVKGKDNSQKVSENELEQDSESELKSNKNARSNKNVILQFFNDDGDISEIGKDIDDDIDDEINGLRNEEERKYVHSDDDIDDVLERALTNESDATTMILDDEPDETNEPGERVLSDTMEVPMEPKQKEEQDKQEEEENKKKEEKKEKEEKEEITKKKEEENDKDEKDEEKEMIEYENNQIFECDGTIINLSSHDHASVTGRNQIRLSLKTTDKVTTRSFETKSDPSKTVNIFALSEFAFIIIFKDTDPTFVTFNEEGATETSLASFKNNLSEITHSAIVKIKLANNEEKDDKNRNIALYGLALHGKSTSSKSTLTKIYQLAYNTNMNQISSIKDLGSFNKKSITKNFRHADKFSFIGWFVNPSKQAQSPASKHNASESESESTIAIANANPAKRNSKGGKGSEESNILNAYELLYKVGDQTVSLDILSRQVTPFKTE